MDQRPPRTSANLGCLGTVLAILVILIPIIGDIVCTVYIIEDDLTVTEKILWILACWLTQWIGRTLYLLVGQRRNRLLGV